MSIHVRSPGARVWHHDWAAPDNLQAPELQGLRPYSHQDRWPNAHSAHSHIEACPLTWACPSEGQGLLHLREGGHPAHSPGSLHKPVDLHPHQDADVRKRRNCGPVAYGQETTDTERQNETTEMCAANQETR